MGLRLLVHSYKQVTMSVRSFKYSSTRPLCANHTQNPIFWFTQALVNGPGMRGGPEGKEEGTAGQTPAA